MDTRKIFDQVFGEQRRGIPVQLTAFDVNQIHCNLVRAYEEMTTAQEEARKLSYRLSDARFQLSLALRELECRIHAQELESGIGGTVFKLYKPLGDTDGDECDRS